MHYIPHCGLSGFAEKFPDLEANVAQNMYILAIPVGFHFCERTGPMIEPTNRQVA